MAKSADKPVQAKHELSEDLKEGQEKVAQSTNKFMDELAALTYYQVHGTKTTFESLPEAERYTWAKMAGAVIVSLDKMNKMIAPKVSADESEARRNKNHLILTTIIRNFVSGLKTLRCPKCGSTPASRAALFPCEELAFRVLDGEVNK